VQEFSAARIDTLHTHGTGCTYSAAITAELAKGTGLIQAVFARQDVRDRGDSQQSRTGARIGPLNHFA